MKQESKLTVKNHFFPILKNPEILWRLIESWPYSKTIRNCSNIIEDSQIIKDISWSVPDQYPKASKFYSKSVKNESNFDENQNPNPDVKPSNSHERHNEQLRN